ncbi:MAG: AsmA family protein, partial [Rhodospirillaceae bacterium]|nr:AsmA family protein [Rhodospirillaceae bacterium]
MKILAYILGGLVVVAVVVFGGAFVWLGSVDWNDYKPEIAEAAREATGRELAIDGDLSVDLSTGLELKFAAGGIRFANAEGAAPADMVTVASVAGQVQLLPMLLSGAMVIDRFVVQEPVINLAVDKTGKANWDFGDKARDRGDREHHGDGDMSLSGLRLADVRIEKGKFGFANATTGQTVAASDITVKVTLEDLASPLNVAGGLVLNNEPVTLKVTMDTPEGMLKGSNATVQAALNTKRVTATYDGRVRSEPTPGLEGEFLLDIASVGKLAAWLDRPLDKQQRDPGPLKVVATMASDGEKAILKQASITGKAIKAKASGSFQAEDETPRFDIKVDVLEANLDAYLPPPAKTAPAASDTAAAAGPPPWSKEEMDFSGLSSANGKASVSLAKILYRGLKIDKGALTLSLEKGVMNTGIAGLTIAGGTIDAKAAVDATDDSAKISYSASIKNINARPLLKTFAGFDRLSGTAHVEADGKTEGQSQFDLVNGLNGKGDIKFLNGAIHGINIAATLRNAQSLGMDKSASATEKTDFAELGGTYVIKQGVVDNQDFKMLAPLVRLSGAGLVPMPPQTVNYGVEAKLVASLEGQGGKDALAGLPIPVRVTGTWQKPDAKVDWDTVFKAIAA